MRKLNLSEKNLITVVEVTVNKKKQKEKKLAREKAKGKSKGGDECDLSRVEISPQEHWNSSVLRNGILDCEFGRTSVNSDRVLSD